MKNAVRITPPFEAIVAAFAPLSACFQPSFLRMMGGRNTVGRVPGADVAGEVVTVGATVAEFRPGDHVFG